MKQVKFTPKSYTGMQVELLKDVKDFMSGIVIPAGTVVTVKSTKNFNGKFTHNVTFPGILGTVGVNVDDTKIVY